MAQIKEARAPKQPRTDNSARRKKPYQGKALKMQVDETVFTRKGLRAFWALDEPGRLQNLLDAGYRFVTHYDDDGIAESALDTVDSKLDGAIYIEAAGRDRHTRAPLRQYLMAIPLDLHEEDKRAKQRRRDSRLSQTKAGERHNDDGVLQKVNGDPINISDVMGSFSVQEDEG